MGLLHDLALGVSLDRSFIWGEFQIYVIWDEGGSATIDAWVITCRTSGGSQVEREKSDVQAPYI